MTTIIKMYLTLKESGTIFQINRNEWRLRGSRIIENTIKYTGSSQWLPCGMLNRKIAKSFQTGHSRKSEMTIFIMAVFSCVARFGVWRCRLWGVS